MKRLLSVLVFAAALSACGSSLSDQAMTIDLDATPCANPTIEFDGSRWETEDVVPLEHGRGQLTGLISFSDDNHARFIAGEGFELTYERLVGFSSMKCMLHG